MKHKHCSFAELNSNGRCIAPCHYNLDKTVPGDCLGLTGKTMDRTVNAEVRVVSGHLDCTHKEYVHRSNGTWTVTDKYRPDVNLNANWGGKK